MSSTFFTGFAHMVLVRLLARGLIEIRAGREVQTAEFVGQALATAGDYRSLISSLSQAFVVCPEVEELYATDDELRELINDIPLTAPG